MAHARWRAKLRSSGSVARQPPLRDLPLQHLSCLLASAVQHSCTFCELTRTTTGMPGLCSGDDSHEVVDWYCGMCSPAAQAADVIECRVARPNVAARVIAAVQGAGTCLGVHAIHDVPGKQLQTVTGNAT